MSNATGWSATATSERFEESNNRLSGADQDAARAKACPLTLN